MGGYGSGRQRSSRRLKTTDTICLDLHYLHRRRPLNTYHCQTLIWQLRRRIVAWVNLIVDRASIRLEFALGPSGINKLHLLPVVWSPCRIGGEQPWFYCLDCGRKVIKLYLGHAGRFACRTCCRLVYASQYEQASDLAEARADRILVRLGLPPGSVTSESAIRPKGMHQKTFVRLLAEYDYWSLVAIESFEEEWNALDERLNSKLRRGTG